MKFVITGEQRDALMPDLMPRMRADENALGVVRSINHAETFSCLEAEREFLRLLHGDCGSPVGVLAMINGSTMTMHAQVFEPPRVEPRTAQVEGNAFTQKESARELWETING